MPGRPFRKRSRPLGRRYIATALALACWPGLGPAADPVTGGLEFRAAAGESACFEAGEIDGCPFQLTIKLTGNPGLRAAVNPANLAEMQAGVAELMARAAEGEAVDDAISIRIPSAHYGPGKYRGVLIFGSRGRSTTEEFCRGAYQPKNDSTGLTGNVTISEFSRTTLAGSYSAALYKRLEKKPGGGFRCTEKPVNASGRFRFSLPIRYDERYEIPMAEDDLILAFGVATWTGGSVNWSGAPAQAPDPLPEPEPPVAVTAESVGCHCDCAALQAGGMNPACRALCAAGGLQCDFIPESVGDGSVDQAIRELEALGFAPETLGVLRQSLEQASPEERRMLVELYKQGMAGSN